MSKIPLVDQDDPIIIEGRRIRMPSGKDVVVSDDSLSQILTFHIDRYFDGVDLYVRECTIKYRNAAREYGVITVPVSLISAEKIAIPWVVGPHVTATQGIVSYQIAFLGVSDPTYVWQTTVSQFTVLDSLHPKTDPPPPDILQSILARLSALETGGPAEVGPPGPPGPQGPKGEDGASVDPDIFATRIWVTEEIESAVGLQNTALEHRLGGVL